MKRGPPSTPAVCTGLYGNSFTLRALDIHMPVIVRRCKSNATYYFRFGSSVAKHGDFLGRGSCSRKGSWAIRVHSEPHWNEMARRVPESPSILLPPLAVRGFGRFGQLLWSASASPGSCNSGRCWGTASISVFRVQA